MDKILEVICTCNGLKKEEVITKDRNHYSCEARFMFYTLCRKVNPRFFTLQKIGNYTLRNHAAVVHGLRKHELLYEQDRYYRKVYNDCINMYNDLENGYITDIREEVIDTKYGKRTAIVSVKYRRYE